MTKVAIIETKPSRNDYHQYFGDHFEFDLYHLCSDPNIKKVLKKDCTIDIDTSGYDWIILVGSDALKHFTKENSVMVYSGKKVGDKYLPIINPAMLAFKPEAKNTWETSKESIIKYIKGEVAEVSTKDITFGISKTKNAINFIKKAIEYDCSYVAVDCETTGLYPRDGYLQGISISYDGQAGTYIDSDCIDEEFENLFQELIKKKTVIFQNAKFDIGFIEYHLNVKFYEFEDVMLLHYIIDETPGTHGLKDLAIRFTPFGNYEKELDEWKDNYCKQNGILKGDFDWGVIPFEVMVPYASMDALVTFILYEKFRKIKQNPKLKYVYDNILIPGTRFIVSMQDNGVPFDTGRLKAAQKLMQDDIDAAIAKLYTNPEIKKFEEAQGKEFNPNSVVQLRVLLFDYLNLPPTGIKTDKGADSTNAEVLEILSQHSEVPKLILDIRQKSKIKNTYLDKIIPQLDRDERLRTNFNLHTTTSGRLSSSGKLNMQQLPRDNPIVKGCIKAKKGYKIVAMDLGTAEMYIAAVLSGDTVLQSVFKEGGDFHSIIAKQVFKLPCSADDVKELYPLQRQAAKAISFGILYGAAAPKISQQISKDSGKPFSIRDAEKVIDQYFNTFKELKKWIDKNKSFIENNGFIYSCFNRKRRLPNVSSSDKGLRGHTVRSGLNFLVQSAASDINLLGAIETNDWIESTKMDAKIFALVHDSVLAEVREDLIDEYSKVLVDFIQKDRGVSITGCPIKCDVEVGDDYSMGKFEEKYPDFACL